jgi:hypothetical protein|tara:strand:+ start:1341 stop:1622 length:282 start_codon:yes stop_codon:yes gene_type:complete
MARSHATQDGDVTYTSEEETARDAEEAAWAAGTTDRKWFVIRKERDQKLVNSDWMANSDVTMTDAWTTYRAALRDLPASQADPDDITFPTEPS